MPAYLSYPDTGQVTHTSATDVEVSGQSFSDINDIAIHIESCTNVYIHDVDFDNCLGCIYIPSCTGQIRIENVRARNTGDGTQGGGHSNVIQLNNTTDDGTGGIRHVVAYGGDTEDMISVFASGGLDAAHPLVIELCHFESPLPPDGMAWSSGSGSGVVVGDTSGSFIVVQDSTFLNCGQSGLGNSRGDHVIFRRNILYGAQRTGGNVGIVMPFSGSAYTGNNEVSDNRVYWRNETGDLNPYFDGGTSGTIAGLSPQTNTFNDTTIDRTTLTIDPTTMAFVGDAPSGPVVLSRTPINGTTAGGTTVVIGGTDFTDAASVLFGATEATSFVVDSDVQITAVTPAHAAGGVRIVVS